MAEAGWYADPDDPNWLRYFDGHEWTFDRAPAPTPAENLAGAGGPDAADADSDQENTWLLGPAPAQPDWSAAPPDWQSTGVIAPVPASSMPPRALAAPPRVRNRSRLLLICGVVVVLVAGLLTGGWFLFVRGGGTTVTYQGHKIVNPQAVLTSAEVNLAAVVSKRHGVQAASTRCYYALARTPAPGAKKTDVDPDLRCGPVLFVDGDASQSYLNFGLTNSVTSGSARLTAATQPEAVAPAAVPADLKLVRTDGKTPPSGSGGLTPPAPPAADKDVLVSADVGSQDVPKAPDGAVMGSLSGGIAVVNLGPVSRYGKGDDARTAPSGQKLIAFKTTGSLGNDGKSGDLSSSAAVSVDHAAGRKLPTKTAAYYVVAVATAATSVELVLVDSGLTQSISLLDGKPGAGNVVVLARKNRTLTVTATSPFTFTYAPEVGFADGTSGTSQTATVTFDRADLSYSNAVATTPATASSPANAILHLDLYYAAQHDPGQFAFPASLVTFTPSGGTPIPATDLGGAAGVYLVFEVPGAITSGTITIGGTATQKYSNTSNTYKESVSTPATLPFALPAG
jgi:hypothetical protein